MKRSLWGLLLGFTACSGSASNTVAPSSPTEPPTRTSPSVAFAALGRPASVPRALPAPRRDDLDALVDQVAAAAEAKDLEALSALMDDEFTVDQEFDLSTLEILAQWDEHPSVLEHLVGLLRGNCAFTHSYDNLLCPRELADADEWGDATRVHFDWRDDGWHWTAYIVDVNELFRPVPAAYVVPSRSPFVPTSDDPDRIRVIVGAHMSEVRRCYARGCSRHGPDLQGRMPVVFTVSREGLVENASAPESELPDDVTACVVSAFSRWRFPKPDAEAPVVVTYPLVFQPR